MEALATHSLLCLVALSTLMGVSGHPYNTPKRDSYLIYSGPDFNTQLNSLRLEGRLLLRFKLRACAEAHIVLMDSTDFATATKKTDILLGGQHNTVSSISAMGGKQPLLEVPSEGILHCSDPREFWVAWNRTGSSISVGQGPTPGMQILLGLNRTDSDLHSISGAALSTGSSYAGVWEVEDSDLLSSLSIRTTPDTSYTHLWRTVENRPRFLAFSVHAVGACGDVSVGLGEQTGDAYYQVSLGFASNNVTISVGDLVVTEQAVNETIMELYCHYPGSVWIEWEQDTIRAGTGLFPGQNELISHRLVLGMGEVNAVGFASEATAEWEFHPDADEFFVFHTLRTDSNVTFNNWLHSPVLQSVPFFVEACSKVHLALATSMDDSAPILIEIGNNANNKGYVSATRGTETKNKAGAEPYLHCDVTRPFRIAWHDGRITISQGTTSKKVIFEEAIGGLQWNTHYLGFGDGNIDSATWLMHVIMGGDDVTLTTVEPSPSHRYHSSVPMLQDWYRTFRLRAASQAALYLTEGPILYTEKPPIALRLDTDNSSTQSIVEWGKSNSKTCTHNDDVVSYGSPMDYVLNWRTGDFSYVVGAPQYDPAKIATCSPRKAVPVPFMVQAVALSSTGTDPAEWNFEVERTDELSFGSSDAKHAETWRWLKLKSLGNTGLVATFRFKGLSGLELVLTPKYLDLDDPNAVRIELENDIMFTYHSNRRSIGNATGILQQDRLVGFWLMIPPKTNDLKIGHGAPTKRLELGKITLDKSFPDFSGLAFRFPPNTEMRMDVFEGTEVQFTTADEPGYHRQAWKEVRNRETLVFSVQGCARSEIALSPAAFDAQVMESSDLLKVQIAKEEAVLRKTNYKIMVIDRKDLLKCDDWNQFWMAWGYDGEIVLGTGTIEDGGLLLNWYNQDPYVIQGLSFSNGYSKETATWRVKLTAGTKFEDSDWIDERHPVTHEGLSGGEIAGIVIGVLILVALVGFIAYSVVKGIPEPIRDGMTAVSGFCVNLFSPSTGSTTRLEEEQTSASNPNAV